MTTITPSPVADDDGLAPILARPFDPIYEAKLLAWAQGWESRQAELDNANSEADRYYRAAYNPRSRIDPNRPSYSQLERRRGHHEHADEIDAANAVRFAEVTR